MMWVIKGDSRGYTVGYHSPDGWYEHRTFDTMAEAEMKVAFLNGGTYSMEVEDQLRQIAQHLDIIVGVLNQRGT